MTSISLNELSLLDQVASRDEAARKMSEFAQVLRQGVEYGVTDLSTPYVFNQTILAPQYNMSQWFADDRVDREEQRLVRNLATKGKFIEDLLANEGTTEVKFNNNECLGLALAYIDSGISISLAPLDRWNTHHITVDVTFVDQENEELQTSREAVQHVSTITHWSEHFDATSAAQQIQSGKYLWDHRSSLYPGLQFCDSAGKYLVQQSKGPVLNAAIKMLRALNTYSLTIKPKAEFVPNDINCKVSPESQSTLEKYAKERTFNCPDNLRRTFSWHAKHNGTGWRTFFHVDSSQSPIRILIGYLGPHLPIASD